MDEDSYGRDFQQKSKYYKDKLPQHQLDWKNKPETFKTYDDALFKIELPKPEFKDDVKFWDVIVRRRSTRRFSKTPLTFMDLSLLLFGMSGITRRFSHGAFRTTPSAGGLYPIETYLIVNNVEEIKEGMYHYNIAEHSLECLREGDFRNDMTSCCLGQKMVYNSAVNFVWTAMIERSKWKYLQRCYRYIYLDGGHIGQNFYLIAEALGLGACTIGAIFDDDLNDLLGINGKSETALYVGATGKI